MQIPNHLVLFSARDKRRACSLYRFSLQETKYKEQMDCHCGIFHCKRPLCCQMRLVTVWRFLLCSLHYGGDSETCLWNLSFRQQIYSQTLLQVLFLMFFFDLGLCRCVQGVVEVFRFSQQQQRRSCRLCQIKTSAPKRYVTGVYGAFNPIVLSRFRGNFQLNLSRFLVKGRLLFAFA